MSYGVVRGTCSLENPQNGFLCYLEDESFIPVLHRTTCMLVLVKGTLLEKCPQDRHHIYHVVDNPRAEFSKLHNKFHEDFTPYSDTNPVDYPGVTFSPGVIIGDGVKIGEGTIIYPNVTIYNNVQIGKNCRIDAGTVIGAEGYSTVIDEYGDALKIRNVGTVIIEDNVELGANNCVDRATFDATVVKRGVKTDNFVHIAHNCEIGPNTRITPMVCIAGSCKIGRNVWIGVGCSIKEHTRIGNDAFLCMGSVVIDDVPDGGKVGGHYAIPHSQWMRHHKHVAGSS